MADTEVPEVQETDETTECSKTEEPEANVEEGSKAEETPATTENGSNEEEAPTRGTAEEQQEKEKDPSKESEGGLGTTVAKHYNEHPENTREERRGSRIFYLRNFNNWIKSVLINEFMDKIRKSNTGNINVLDLGCGKGGDLLKWQKGRVSNLVCADIAEVSMKQCEQRYNDMVKNRHSRRYQEPLFDIQFITADCSKEDLTEKYSEKNQDIMFDMTSCQFALHYSFETQEQAEKMLQNACERLKPGGYFIGTVPCAYELVHRLRQSEGLSFGNEVYNLTFTNKDEFPLFGHKYDFHLDGVVDCPEFLVHFPTLEKMAEKFDMKLELTKGFHDFFHENLETYKSLMYRMQALETYPPKRDHDKLTSSQDDAYSEAKDFLDGAKAANKEEPSPKYRDHRNKIANHVGTLSKDEWEAAGIYMVFAFKKAEADTPMEEDKTEETKEEERAGESEEKKEDEGMDEGENAGGGEEADSGEVADGDEVADGGEVADGSEVAEDAGNGDQPKKDADAEEGESKAAESSEMQTVAEEVKVTTPQRGTRKTRSMGGSDDAGEKKTEGETKQEEEEVKPRRETRKRKSTGGTSSTGEDEPPEKKKA